MMYTLDIITDSDNSGYVSQNRIGQHFIVIHLRSFQLIKIMLLDNSVQYKRVESTYEYLYIQNMVHLYGIHYEDYWKNIFLKHILFIYK